MRGLDGNYINAQGDATSRMQVVYQAEQNRQQVQAQAGSAEALRKLREQVEGAEKSMERSGPKALGEEGRSGSQAFTGEESPRRGAEGGTGREVQEDAGRTDGQSRTHIDIRV